MADASWSASTAPEPEFGDYVELLKPRVMRLVVFTAATGLIVAPGSVNPLVAAIAILCIAVGAGAAGALNMALEGETDALMRRTRGRPVAAGRVRKNDAMAFGVILSLFSVMLLGMNANWLAAGSVSSGSALLLGLALLAACSGENPAPTADAHQPANDAEYGTGAQETRSPDEARNADSPNDDGDGVEEADEPPRGEEPRRE